jgi:hypothetical protein
MTLSPAAQAVLDAFGHCQGDYEAQARTLNPTPIRIAAALRAAADQVVPEADPNRSPCREGCVIGAAAERIRRDLLAIAAELDPQP